MPHYQWTDLIQQQLDTTAGNLGVLPKAQELGAGVNDFLRGERAKTLGTIPGLGNLEDLSLQNLTNWSQGRLGGDETSRLARGANAQAFAGGYGGGGLRNNLVARDLGLGSLQLQMQAFPLTQQYAQNEYRLRGIPEYNPASMFLDPMQSAEFNARQRAAEYQRNWLAAQIAAQPEPWQQSIMNSTQQLGALADKAFASYFGGMIGGAAGMGGGGGGGLPGGFAGGAPPPVMGNDYWAPIQYPQQTGYSGIGNMF